MSGVILFSVMIAVAAVLGVVIIRNRTGQPDYAAIEDRPAEGDLPLAGDALTVLTWNVGYGALGAGTDFVIDGGRRIRGLSRADIAKASAAIAQTLHDAEADVLCLQELAAPSFLTRGVDVCAIVDARLRGYHRWFWADFVTRLIPPSFQFRHGMGSYASRVAGDTEVLAIHGAETLFLGFLKKAYVGLVTRFPIADSPQQWCVINVHLPVFDVGQSQRATYVRCVLDLAEAEHAKGHLVVITGDWNMQVALDDGMAALGDVPEWLTAFPRDALQQGWQLVQANGAPTVRALNTPYDKDKTFTASIDGFVVSPNVEVVTAQVLDQQFAQSDHNPVVARLRRA